MACLWGGVPHFWTTIHVTTGQDLQKQFPHLAERLAPETCLMLPVCCVQCGVENGREKSLRGVFGAPDSRSLRARDPGKANARSQPVPWASWYDLALVGLFLRSPQAGLLLEAIAPRNELLDLVPWTSKDPLGPVISLSWGDRKGSSHGH